MGILLKVFVRTLYYCCRSFQLSLPTLKSGPMTYELTSILEEADNVYVESL